MRSLFTKILVKELRQIVKSSGTFNYCTLKAPWNVLFFGTDNFSVVSLRALFKEYKKGELLKNLEVVTSSKIKTNAVKHFAQTENLILHDWPIVLPVNKYDLGLVVSFGNLIPEEIINTFPLGMLNVHASLLPRWRGAAPIIYAIANGDKKTGVTIMKIKPNKFDIGEILLQQSIDIPYDMKMPDLHEKLANIGAKNLVDCLRELPHSLANVKIQPEDSVTYAPRINTDIAHVAWDKLTARAVYNLERALTGVYNLKTTWNNIPVKVYNIKEFDMPFLNSNENTEKMVPGAVVYDKVNKVLQVQCSDRNWVTIKKIKILGKKIMTACDFNNGYLKNQPFHLRVFR